MLESRDVTDFRNGVLSGSWTAVEKLLGELPKEHVTDEIVSRASEHTLHLNLTRTSIADCPFPHPSAKVPRGARGERDQEGSRHLAQRTCPAQSRLGPLALLVQVRSRYTFVELNVH